MVFGNSTIATPVVYHTIFNVIAIRSVNIPKLTENSFYVENLRLFIEQNIKLNGKADLIDSISKIIVLKKWRE